MPAFSTAVCMSPLGWVPVILRGIFIFLGSVKLSVQNNISSIMLIPVIDLSLSKFKTCGASKQIVSTKARLTSLFKNIPWIPSPWSIMNERLSPAP